MTDEDEAGSAPAFTSLDSADVAENQTMAYTAMATDADAGDTVSYSLSGGADMALFTIDATTGVVSFIDAPDFENPDDAGGDNVYNITVTATDGINETTQDVAITVTNVNDNVTGLHFSATASVAENQSDGDCGLQGGGDGRGWRRAHLQPVRDGCGTVHDQRGDGRSQLQRGARRRESGRR